MSEEKIICPNCGKELEEKQKFCTKCGYEFNSKKSVGINITLAVVLSILVCIVPNLIHLYGQIWLYIYSFLVIPLLLFMIIITYKQIYNNKISNKPNKYVNTFIPKSAMGFFANFLLNACRLFIYGVIPVGITYLLIFFYLNEYRAEVSRQETIFQQIIAFENWTLYAIFGAITMITVIYIFTLFFTNMTKNDISEKLDRLEYKLDCYLQDKSNKE